MSPPMEDYHRHKLSLIQPFLWRENGQSFLSKAAVEGEQSSFEPLAGDHRRPVNQTKAFTLPFQHASPSIMVCSLRYPENADEARERRVHEGFQGFETEATVHQS